MPKRPDPYLRLKGLRTGLVRSYRQTRRLFHLAVGAAFLLLALAGASLTVAEWRASSYERSGSPARLVLFGGFTALLAIFGLYSFAKARSVR